MNIRAAKTDIENLKVFQTLVDTMRSIGSALYPKLSKRLQELKKLPLSHLAAMNSAYDYVNQGERKNNIVHPLIRNCFLREEKTQKTLIVIVGSNKPFCGDMNRRLIKQTTQYFTELETNGQDFNIIVVGKKLLNSFNSIKEKVIGSHIFPEDIFKKNDFDNYDKVVASILAEGLKFDRMVFIYNAFVRNEVRNSYETRPEIVQLFPYKKREVTGIDNENDPYLRELIFEPDFETATFKLITHYLSSEIYTIFLNSLTAINFTRMNSMNLASSSIKIEIQKLSRTVAKERQRIITKNLIEVIAASIQEQELQKIIR